MLLSASIRNPNSRIEVQQKPHTHVNMLISLNIKISLLIKQLTSELDLLLLIVTASTTALRHSSSNVPQITADNTMLEVYHLPPLHTTPVDNKSCTFLGLDVREKRAYPVLVTNTLQAEKGR